MHLKWQETTMASILRYGLLKMTNRNARKMTIFRSSLLSLRSGRKAILQRPIATSTSLQTDGVDKMKNNQNATLPGKDSLTFDDHHIAYKNKSNWELLRAVLVYRSLTIDYLVENSVTVRYQHLIVRIRSTTFLV